VTHLTANGPIRITRRVWWRPEGATERPVDAWLGIEDATVSVGARELCCWAALAGGGFARGSQTLARLGQIRVSDEQLRVVTETEGRKVRDAVRTGAWGPDWDVSACREGRGEPTRVVVGLDGVMVPVITAQEKAKRRTNRRRRRKVRRCSLLGRRFQGATGPWKEFKIAAFYDPSGEHRYALGVSGGPDVLGQRVRRTAGRLKLPEADQKVSVTDGAPWIRRQLETRLPMLDARILDYYHVMEHVATAAAVCFGEGTAGARAWCEAASQALHQQGAPGLLAAIYETLKATRSPTKRQTLQELQQYVAKRGDMLDYPTFLAEGWDIGSGPTEAFCKTLTSRLKGSGMRWNTPNAEALMALAALWHSNLWKPYWNAQQKAAA
jgi:hypothetical protein